MSTAYNQWTQFESFPQFMEGVERVQQKDDTQLHWVAEIGGDKREWDAEITEQHPDHRVAWKALNQQGPNGVVTFHKLDDSRTKVMVQMDYEPEGVKESVGSFVGFDSHRVKGDLESFKTFIESRGDETGAWRGNVTRTTASTSRSESRDGASAVVRGRPFPKAETRRLELRSSTRRYLARSASSPAPPRCAAKRPRGG